MPRIALACLCLVAGACSFDADYSGGAYYCSGGATCPSGFECRTDLSPPECRELRKDAAIDTLDDAMPDGPPPALTCVDPGILQDNATVMGTTVGRNNTMMSSCGGSTQFAADAVYRITTTAPNQQLVVHITGTLSAYVVNTCMPTVACLGGTVANNNSPISVTAAAASDYWVVVDNLAAAVTGSYTLRVDVQ